MEFLIDDETLMTKWDAFVSAQRTGHFMQSLSWGGFRESNGWGCKHFMAAENGVVKGVALIVTKRLPVIKKMLFYMPRGPVIDPSDKDVLSFLLINIRKYVQTHQGFLLRTDPYFEESEDIDDIFEHAGYRKIKRKWSFWNCPKFVFWLDLEGGVDGVFGQMKGKKRWEIRSALKKGVQVIKGDENNLAQFHELMIETAARKNLGVHDQSYYDHILKILNDSAKSQLFLAKYGEETAAAGISIVYGKNAWLLYLSSSERHFYLNPNRMLQWEMIKWAIECGCERYDFRGTATDDPPSPKDPGYGVYTFKKSFNPRFVRMAGYYDYCTNRFLYRMFILFEDYFLTAVVNLTNRLLRFRDKALGK